jgi:PhnB protein
MSSVPPLGLYPHLFVQDAPAAVRFYGAAFGAVELFRNALPDGRVLFIEVALGPGRLLVSEETPALNALAPPTIGGSPVLLLLELDEVDVVAERAIAAGATVEMPIQEMFWGERYGVLRDPFGHRWALSTARQQLTPDDIAERTPGDAAT